jgi:hypothetical protein
MKMFLVAATVAVSTLIASAAQAQGVGIYSEVGVSVLPAPGMYDHGSGVVVQPVPHVAPVHATRRSPCLPGYHFYPGKNQCIELHEPVLVERAVCTPGAIRHVADPARPGGFRIQRCI